MERFEELLKDLGQLINLPLHPDKNHVCRLNINNILHIQMECDIAKERLLLAAFVGELSPGRFRENFLKEALKTNALYPPFVTFAYSPRNNQLALFTYLSIANLTGETLAAQLSRFIDKADQWRIGIESGQAPTVAKEKEPSKNFPFGIKS